MALKGLIKKQTIIIDDHKRGSGEVKNWDDSTADVHIDKMTNYKINEERQKIRIKLPINSERPLTIENAKKKQLENIPRQLRREIQDAFESEKRVRQVLSNISKHFELEWTKDKIATYSNDILLLYAQTYTDEDGKQYYISVDNEKIKIAENNGFARRFYFPIFVKP